MKLNLKDFEKYLFPIKRIFSKYRQIKTIDQVKTFIQEQSAQVTQMTLYGYLKTRMGAKHVIMFEDKDFLRSINIAKWQIYGISLIDCTFFCFSFLYKEKNFLKTDQANQIFFEILNTEKAGGMDIEAYNNSTKEFNLRFSEVNWETYYNNNPFVKSSQALYNWAPVANELKSIDRKIVLNSMILKWDNIKEEFSKLIKI